MQSVRSTSRLRRSDTVLQSRNAEDVDTTNESLRWKLIALVASMEGITASCSPKALRCLSGRSLRRPPARHHDIHADQYHQAAQYPQEDMMTQESPEQQPETQEKGTIAQ